MILRAASVLAVLIAGQAAFAGANNAVVECKSSSGRTTLTLDYPVDMTSAAATLTVDGKVLNYVNQDKVDDANANNENLSKEYPGFVVSQFKANQDKANVDLWIGMDTGNKFDENDLVLTSTSTPVRTKLQNGYALKFQATLSGVDPRNTEAALPTITLTCNYKYQI